MRVGEAKDGYLSKQLLVDLPAMSPDIRKNLAEERAYVRQEMIAHEIF